MGHFSTDAMPLVFFGAVAIATVAESMRGVVCVAAQSVIYFTDKLQCWVNLMVLCLVDS